MWRPPNTGAETEFARCQSHAKWQTCCVRCLEREVDRLTQLVASLSAGLPSAREAQADGPSHVSLGDSIPTANDGENQRLRDQIASLTADHERLTAELEQVKAEREALKARALERARRHATDFPNQNCRKFIYDPLSSPCTCATEYMNERDAALSQLERVTAESDDLKGTVELVSMMLGWMNVPPRATLEAHLRALRQREQNLGKDLMTAIEERDAALSQLTALQQCERSCPWCGEVANLTALAGVSFRHGAQWHTRCLDAATALQKENQTLTEEVEELKAAYGEMSSMQLRQRERATKAEHQLTALQQEHARLQAMTKVLSDNAPEIVRLLCCVRSLDCGAHYCRYCLAKSPTWEHSPCCPYPESQRDYEQARALVAQIEAAIDPPSSPSLVPPEANAGCAYCGQSGVRRGDGHACIGE